MEDEDLEFMFTVRCYPLKGRDGFSVVPYEKGRAIGMEVIFPLTPSPYCYSIEEELEGALQPYLGSRPEKDSTATPPTRRISFTIRKKEGVVEAFRVLAEATLKYFHSKGFPLQRI